MVWSFYLDLFLLRVFNPCGTKRVLTKKGNSMDLYILDPWETAPLTLSHMHSIQPHRGDRTIVGLCYSPCTSEPVWPSGKASGW